MVGASRFELLTPGPPCQCATRLRHAPMPDLSMPSEGALSAPPPNLPVDSELWGCSASLADVGAFYTLRRVRSSAEALDGALFRPDPTFPPYRTNVAAPLARRAVRRWFPIRLLRALRIRERPAMPVCPLGAVTK